MIRYICTSIVLWLFLLSCDVNTVFDGSRTLALDIEFYQLSWNWTIDPQNITHYYLLLYGNGESVMEGRIDKDSNSLNFKGTQREAISADGEIYQIPIPESPSVVYSLELYGILPDNRVYYGSIIFCTGTSTPIPNLLTGDDCSP